MIGLICSIVSLIILLLWVWYSNEYLRSINERIDHVRDCCNRRFEGQSIFDSMAMDWVESKMFEEKRANEMKIFEEHQKSQRLKLVEERIEHEKTISDYD